MVCKKEEIDDKENKFHINSIFFIEHFEQISIISTMIGLPVEIKIKPNIIFKGIIKELQDNILHLNTQDENLKVPLEQLAYIKLIDKKELERYLSN